MADNTTRTDISNQVVGADAMLHLDYAIEDIIRATRNVRGVAMFVEGYRRREEIGPLVAALGQIAEAQDDLRVASEHIAELRARLLGDDDAREVTP